MASYNASLSVPAAFPFDTPDHWPKWKRRFQQYRLASGLSQESEERQVNTLLYCLGEEAEDILASTNIGEEDRKKYDSVLAKFDSFFSVRKNVIIERAKFNKRSQLPDEPVEQFIASLYNLAADCNFGELKGELIRDRIVVGIRDASLSERLQIDPELTLEKAKTVVRQREAVREQQATLKGDRLEAPQLLEAVGQKNQNSMKRQTNAPPQKRCTRCGKDQHPHDACPAKDATCRKCQKKGHFAVMCRTKILHDVEQDNPTLDSFYLDTIRDTEDSTFWMTEVKVNSIAVTFKVDTGAEVTAISEDTLQTLGQLEVNKPDKKLCGPNGVPLALRGSLTVTLSQKQHKCDQEIFVVKQLKHNLLGLPAIKALHLLSVLDNLECDPSIAIKQKFPSLFTGLGTLQGDYEIQVKPDAEPFSLGTARNIPLPLRDKVKQELDAMEAQGVISKVQQPTPWCAGMVVVKKKNGGVRICVDLKPLNRCVLREHHPLPKVNDILGQLTGATMFTKLDANSGFWQVPLAEKSRLFTTFITPFGRYCYNKLPFGISSAPEHFQRRMHSLLEGLQGVLCVMDDILIFGTTTQEHNSRLQGVLKRLSSAGITLNSRKCEFCKTSLTFLGHVIDQRGITADPNKTAAIQQMETPKSVSELRRFLGMVNQLGKFSPNIAELSKPLRELLSAKKAWLWTPAQDKAFTNLKKELTTPNILTLYNPNADTIIPADASSHGVGAVLLQKVQDQWHPVAYASRSMTCTESRYAQIEKEALAATWACEKFATYIQGKTITLETDHKPLVPLLSHQHLDKLPPRVLRFRLQLMRFDYVIKHVPGKSLHTADALSRAPLEYTVDSDELMEIQEIECHISTVVDTLPVSSTRLTAIIQAQANDPVCSTLISYCSTGWPVKSSLPDCVKPYWTYQGELSVLDNLLLYQNRLVIPRQQQQQILQKLHNGHQGIQRCRLRAKSLVWWLHIRSDIDSFIKQCHECQKSSAIPREPLITATLPSHPWEKVASDLFHLNNCTYLIVVDYFSLYPEVIQLKSTTSASVIKALKSIFSHHGVPSVFMSDNGPQFVSKEMKQFADTYGFTLLTSSPHYPQSNGLAERTIQTIKALLQDSPDPYLALLSFRTTPIPWCSFSPAQLLMGRQLRTDIPTPKTQLIPQWSYIQEFQEKDSEYKAKQRRDYNERHRVRPLDPLLPDTPVWIRTDQSQTTGHIHSPTNTPRSYIVTTTDGRELRRTRQHLAPRSPVQTRSRSGVPVRPPDRLTL